MPSAHSRQKIFARQGTLTDAVESLEIGSDVVPAVAQDTSSSLWEAPAVEALETSRQVQGWHLAVRIVIVVFEANGVEIEECTLQDIACLEGACWQYF